MKPHKTIKAEEKRGRRSLIQEFLSLIGKEELIVYESDFLPLLVLIDWFSYYDRNNTIKDAYPIFCYKKGCTIKLYISFPRYHNSSKSAFRSYLEGELDIKKINSIYDKIKKEIEIFYKNYYKKKTWGEGVLLSTLKKVHGCLRKLCLFTLFLDRLDQRAIKEVLMEKNVEINLSEIWKISQVLDFISIESKNVAEIISTIQKKENHEKLQHVFTNYTHVPSAKDVEDELRSFNLKNQSKELEKNKKMAEKNKKEKDNRRIFLSGYERKILKFIDWSSWLRDDRKIIINKADVLLFNITSKLYEEWGIKQDLAPVSFVSEVLGGKKYVVKNIDKIRQRKNRAMLIYFGKDKYKEDTNQSEKEIRVLDKYVLLRNKPQKDNILEGEVASLGYAKGRVRIIIKKSEFKSFQRGEILVARMTRPEFAPLMKKAAAIITEEGGITSHAAIISRELRKPCIIGTRIATQVLHDGDLVELDTNVGIVRILKGKKYSKNY